MSDSIHRVTRPTGTWQIVRCELRYASVRPGFRWRAFWQGLQQSFRLMVGVQDYQKIPAAHAAAASRPAADERA